MKKKKKVISENKLRKILSVEDLKIELGKLLDETENEPLKLKLLDFDLGSIPILDYELPPMPEYELPLIQDYDLDTALSEYDCDLKLLDYDIDLEQLKKENEKLEKELQEILKKKDELL